MAKFVQGQSGNPGGAVKGARKRLVSAFIDALSKDFQEGGIVAIRRAREKDPMGYIKTIAALVPQELEVTRPLGALSDEELAGIAERLRSAFDPAGVRPGDLAPQEPPQIN